MLTQQQVLDAVRGGRQSQCLDDRDYSRLVDFFPAEQWPVFGFKRKEGRDPPKPKPWTREAILEQLREDLGFAFEKALGKRGISASMMYEVVKMWLWVLEDDLQHSSEYALYGLPLLKAVAAKYGFENPIGEKSGTEFEFSAEGAY